MKKSFLYPIVFMAILTSVFVFILAFLNESTIAKIEFNEEIELKKKILYVFDIDYDDDNPEEIDNIFKKYITYTKDENNQKIYKAVEDGEVLGYAYPSSGAGLWGSIEAYIGLSEDGENLIGLEFISQDETPGLGGRIDENAFKEQFRGIKLIDGQDYIIYTPSAGGNVDAIAGATLTSQAVADFLNKDLKEIKEGGILGE